MFQQCFLLQGTRLNTIKKFVELADVHDCILVHMPHVTAGHLKVGQWNERVRAKRCDALDWDQIGMNLDQIGLTAHAGASKKKGSNSRKT